MIVRPTVLLTLVLHAALSWSTTPDSIPPASACSPEFTENKAWAFAEPMARLFHDGYLHGDDVVGLVALSRAEFWKLLDRGQIESAPGFDFFPYPDNPHVNLYLEEHPSLDWNGLSSRRQERAAADQAWARTIRDLFLDRLTRAGARTRLTPEYMDTLTHILRPSPAPEILFDVPLAEIEQIPEGPEVGVGTPMELAGARLNRDLARRLNMGDDLVDLERWSGLRAIAETFAVAWTAEPRGPDLESALLKYFSALPREAGLVVSLRSGAFRTIVWDPDEAPTVPRLRLSDVAGLQALGSEELALLKRLPQP